MARPAHPIEVIDLVSDDEDSDTPPIKQEASTDPPAAEQRAAAVPSHAPLAAGLPRPDRAVPGAFPQMEQQHPHAGGTYMEIDGEQVFIPDDFVGGDDPFAAEPVADAPEHDMARDEQLALTLAREEAADHDLANEGNLMMDIEDAEVTPDTCLRRVLAIFPDVSHEYVTKLYTDFDREGDYEILPGQARLDNIIEQLVSNDSYPRQQKGKALKRKREDSIDEGDFKKWEAADRAAVPGFLKGSMQAMLKAEFQEIPVNHINATLLTHQHLYQTYAVLAKEKDDVERNGTRTFGKGRPSQRPADAATIATNCGWPMLLEELNAARSRRQQKMALRAAEDAQKRAEKANLERAIASGETAECTACFDDLPMNRQIHCNGEVAHFVCWDCATAYIEAEVGESRCRVLCTAGCGAGFATNQLNLLSDKKLLQKLSQLEQEKAIRDAGLDDLEECPFCDYKAILPPIEEDFEFRCAAPECEKVSCRRCKSASHVPISCEQHAKDNKINSRHKVEEAMTAALIRSCNKCQKHFIKDYGCNKMACPSCGNKQCYVCSKDVHDYNHFDQTAPRNGGPATKSKLCPLYDDVEERHEREVKEAEAAARAQVVEDNPDVTAEDLEIKVSDAIKKGTVDRARQMGGGLAAYGGFGGLGGRFAQLANGIGGRHAGAGAMLDEMFGAARDDGAFDFDQFLGPPARNHDIDGARELQHRVAELEAMRNRQGAHMAVHNPAAAGLVPAAGGIYQHPAHVQGYIPVLGYNLPAHLAQAPAPDIPQWMAGFGAVVDNNVMLGQHQLPLRHQPQAASGAFPQAHDQQQQLRNRREDYQARVQARVQQARTQTDPQRAREQIQQARAEARQAAQGRIQRNFQELEQLRQQHHERAQNREQQRQQHLRDHRLGHEQHQQRLQQMQALRQQRQQQMQVAAQQQNGAMEIAQFEQYLREHRERGV